MYCCTTKDDRKIELVLDFLSSSGGSKWTFNFLGQFRMSTPLTRPESVTGNLCSLICLMLGRICACWCLSQTVAVTLERLSTTSFYHCSSAFHFELRETCNVRFVHVKKISVDNHEESDKVPRSGDLRVIFFYVMFVRFIWDCARRWCSSTGSLERVNHKTSKQTNKQTADKQSGSKQTNMLEQKVPSVYSESVNF